MPFPLKSFADIENPCETVPFSTHLCTVLQILQHTNRSKFVLQNKVASVVKQIESLAKLTGRLSQEIRGI